MEDNEGVDSKIIAVAVKDPLLANIKEIDDLDENYKKEIRHFFETYRELENKKVKTIFWHNKDIAHKLIKEAREKYSKGE